MVRLVKYDKDQLPLEYLVQDVNPMEGKTFADMGEVKHMYGHRLCLDIETGKPYILHEENLIELSEDEV